MGRAPRADEGGGIYHALNRGNARHDIFFYDADFEEFERLVAEGLQNFPAHPDSFFRSGLSTGPLKSIEQSGTDSYVFHGFAKNHLGGIQVRFAKEIKQLCGVLGCT